MHANRQAHQETEGKEMTRETSLLLAAVHLLGPSVGGSDENFDRIATQAVERALLVENEIARQLGRVHLTPETVRAGGAL